MVPYCLNASVGGLMIAKIIGSRIWPSTHGYVQFDSLNTYRRPMGGTF